MDQPMYEYEVSRKYYFTFSFDIRDVRDRQTSDVRQKHRLMHLPVY